MNIQGWKIIKSVKLTLDQNKYSTKYFKNVKTEI